MKKVTIQKRTVLILSLLFLSSFAAVVNLQFKTQSKLDLKIIKLVETGDSIKTLQRIIAIQQDKIIALQKDNAHLKIESEENEDKIRAIEQQIRTLRVESGIAEKEVILLRKRYNIFKNKSEINRNEVLTVAEKLQNTVAQNDILKSEIVTKQKELEDSQIEKGKIEKKKLDNEKELSHLKQVDDIVKHTQLRLLNIEFLNSNGKTIPRIKNRNWHSTKARISLSHLNPDLVIEKYFMIELYDEDKNQSVIINNPKFPGGEDAYFFKVEENNQAFEFTFPNYEITKNPSKNYSLRVSFVPNIHKDDREQIISKRDIIVNSHLVRINKP